VVKTLRESKAKLSELVEPNANSNAEWIRELKALQKKYTKRIKGRTEAVLAELREDRL
jgi:hypothetical protein